MKPIVLGYYAEWTSDVLPPERIVWGPLTHLNHSFALIKADSVQFPEETHCRTLLAEARRNRVKVLLAVGGAESNAALTAHCATESGMRALVDTLVTFSRKLGYDGIDVDWEFPENTTERDRLSRFIALLRERLPRPALLTIAVNGTDWSGRWFDAPALLPHLDWASVMCYDFYGPWSDRAGYHAALFPSKTAAPGPQDTALTAAGAMTYWNQTKHWPREKLLLGIPLYARGFQVAKWGDKVTRDPKLHADLTYRAAATSKTLQPSRDDDAVAALWTAKDTGMLYAADDAVTARRKGVWARQNGYAGVFFWELSQDTDGKSASSVIAAARQGLEAGK